VRLALTLTGMASARLTSNVRGWTIGVGICVWASGAGWLIAHYLLSSEGTFGLAGSPSEPWWLKAHGAFAFLSIWMAGLLGGMHVANAWGQHRRRWSGGTLLAAVLVLIVTGYLLYYVGADRPRALISALHWILGLCLPAAYLTHRLTHRFRRR